MCSRIWRKGKARASIEPFVPCRDEAMAETYPGTPVPSMVSSPEIIDEMWSYASDQGYQFRRAKHSRPRRRYSLEYLGLTVPYVRVLRDFFQRQRLGVTSFAWAHPTAVDVAQCQPTTPVQLLYQHGLFTGAWVGISNSPNAGINGGFFPVTWLTDSSLSLNGTTAAGIAGTATVVVYLPRAVGRFQEDTWPSPATLIGPDQVPHAPTGRRTGNYNVLVTIEEIF